MESHDAEFATTGGYAPPVPAPEPAPLPQVTIMWETDDIATVSIGDQEYPVTYDDCGTAGMAVALRLVTALTSQYGIPLHIHGTPGV